MIGFVHNGVPVNISQLYVNSLFGIYEIVCATVLCADTLTFIIFHSHMMKYWGMFK